MTLFEIGAYSITGGAILVLYRLIVGPTFFDRVLATNVLGTKTVVLLALIGYIFERPEFMDLALAYAIINFIGTIAVLKIMEKKTLR